MTKDEQKEQEFLALGKEIFERREALIEEYKRAHKLPQRGIIDIPEIRALEAEEKQRFIKICEKCKD